MTDDEIRTIVRQVLAARGVAHGAAHAPGPGSPCHPSALRLHMTPPTEVGSPCIIEPAVTCNNCGYCLVQGH